MDDTTTQAMTGLIAMLSDAGHTVFITFLYLFAFTLNTTIISTGVLLSTACYIRLFPKKAAKTMTEDDYDGEQAVFWLSHLASNFVGFMALLIALIELHEKHTNKITGEVKEGGYSAGQQISACLLGSLLLVGSFTATIVAVQSAVWLMRCRRVMDEDEGLLTKA